MPQYSGVFNLSQVANAVRSRNWPSTVTPTVEYLVVSGGGGGSPYSGGGAGGLLTGLAAVTPGSAITVTIGGGGSGSGVDNTPGSAGNASVFGAISPVGGGGAGGKWTGGANGTVPATGGSGGGGSAQYTIGGGSFLQLGGLGTPGQGKDGGLGTLSSSAGPLAGGGGGGAGSHGGDANTTGYPGNGGNGLASNISGTRTVYAGGGNAGSYTYGASSGGAGGGGNGGAGTANTGGGGGTSASGTGGSGIVIISYPDTYAAAASTTGSPTVSTSGSGSLSFSGASTLYLGYGAQTPFSFGTGDFTIEFWLYCNNFTGGPILMDWRAGGANGALPTIYVTTGGVLTYFANSADRITSSAISTSTWYHVVVCRTGTSTKMFVNGSQAGSTYTDSTNYSVNSGGPIIGNASGTALNGYMSNIRIVKGNCVYTGTFTVPTSPLTATQSAGTNISAITGTQTSLLLNTVSGAYLADGSTNAYAATVTGSTISWNQLSPFSTGLGYKNRVYRWTSSGSITF